MSTPPPALRGTVALDAHRVAGLLREQVPEELLSKLVGDKPKRFLVHGAGVAGGARGDVLQLLGEYPVEGIKPPLGSASVAFQSALDQSGDGGLGAAHWPVQQDDALFGAVAVRGALEHVDQAHQRDVEPEDGIFAFSDFILEEVVDHDLLFVVHVLVLAVRQDHVVHSLEGRTDHGRVFGDYLQVILEGALPVEVFVFFFVLER